MERWLVTVCLLVLQLGFVGCGASGRRPEAGADVHRNAPEGAKAPAMAKPTLLTLLACWADQADSYAFEQYESPGLMVEINGRLFGEYRSTPGGLVYMTQADLCVPEPVPPGPSSVSTDMIFGYLEVVSGVPVISAMTDDPSKPYESLFDQYNPAFIAWAVDTMIPAPTDTIGGTKAQAIYSTMFARFFRTLGETYAWLQAGGNIQAKVDTYLGIALGGGYAAIDHLWDTYDSVFPAYSNSPFGGSQAVGFWLRRTADGSADELWRGVKKVLSTFDKQWYVSVKKKYKAPDLW